jgi:hypothetical protein
MCSLRGVSVRVRGVCVCSGVCVECKGVYVKLKEGLKCTLRLFMNHKHSDGLHVYEPW